MSTMSTALVCLDVTSAGVSQLINPRSISKSSNTRDSGRIDAGGFFPSSLCSLVCRNLRHPISFGVSSATKKIIPSPRLRFTDINVSIVPPTIDGIMKPPHERIDNIAGYSQIVKIASNFSQEQVTN